MGDDRDGREDDADLEPDLGQLEQQVFVVVVVDVLFVVVDLLGQRVIGGDQLFGDAVLVHRCRLRGFAVGPRRRSGGGRPRVI